MGPSDEYRRCRALCRERSAEAAQEMIRLFTESEDDRVRFMAAQWTFEQAWGKAPPYDPNQERDAATLDLGRLNPEQRKQLRELLQRAVADTVPDTEAADIA